LIYRCIANSNVATGHDYTVMWLIFSLGALQGKNVNTVCCISSVCLFEMKVAQLIRLMCSGQHVEFVAGAGDHPSAHSASGCAVDNDMDFPPPPPAQLLNQPAVTGTDSDDEFPLPPPPDEEMSTPQSVWSTNRHAGLTHSASVKVQMRPGPPVAAKHYRMTVVEQQQSVATATAVNRSSADSDFLSQIRDGILLRRVESNDRSAPRVPGKR